jgi:hypothetical protein
VTVAGAAAAEHLIGLPLVLAVFGDNPAAHRPPCRRSGNRPPQQQVLSTIARAFFTLSLFVMNTVLRWHWVAGTNLG